MAIFVAKSVKRSIEEQFAANFVWIGLDLRTLDFFEYSPFFHKKWVINIYFTSKKYTSFRKYDSKGTVKKR